MRTNKQLAPLWLRVGVSACLSVWLLSGNVVVAEELTLATATKKTLTQNPLLNVYKLQDEAVQARRETAALRPAFDVGVEVENVAGANAAQGFDEADITVSLSSVIELGSKRSARIAVMDSKSGMLRIELQAKALDVLGAMTSQFVSTLALKEQQTLAQQALVLANRTTTVVKERVNAGVAPDAELLRAKALESQTRISAERIDRQLDIAFVGLSTYWGGREQLQDELTYDVAGDLFNFGEEREFTELWELVAASPVVRIFASQERLRDAELLLAESKNRQDIRWSVGIRRLEGLNDNALVGSLEFPLNSGRRNRGEVAAVRVERAEVGVRREQALNQLYARLYDAYATRSQSIKAINALANETIPDLTKALEETHSAFETGLYSYLELIAAQRALIEAKQTYIATAANALQAAVIIEQLTGISLQPGTDTGQVLRKTHQ